MADYYTQASFIIECSSEQASQAIDALFEIDDGGISEYAEKALAKGNDQELTAVEIIMSHCIANHPSQDLENLVTTLDWNFRIETCSSGLWITDDELMNEDEPINIDQAAVFTQAVLLAFDLPSIVVIQAAHKSSKSVGDSFSGSARVVSKDHIRCDSTSDFIESERQAHDNNERYFACSITEVNGEHEYTNNFLMACSNQVDPEQRLDEIFVSLRGEGDKESDSFVWYDSGTAAKNPEMHELAPHEYSVMKEHLTVL